MEKQAMIFLVLTYVISLFNVLSSGMGYKNKKKYSNNNFISIISLILSCAFGTFLFLHMKFSPVIGLNEAVGVGLLLSLSLAFIMFTLGYVITKQIVSTSSYRELSGIDTIAK